MLAKRQAAIVAKEQASLDTLQAKRDAATYAITNAREKQRKVSIEEPSVVTDDGQDGTQIPVTDLVGKNILLYFSVHRSRACCAFLPKLVEAYHEIKAKDDAFEVIFISSDKGQNAFDKVFATMSWLALPFGDSRKASLKSKFKVPVIPKLIAISPTGQTVTKEATNLIRDHGANAYPFTAERMKEIEAEAEFEAISEVFPVDKRLEMSDRGNDLGWACVLLLESLIPVVVDPKIGRKRLLVTQSVKQRATEMAETWKASLEERGGIENVKTPDVHTFLQHLVTFGDSEGLRGSQHRHLHRPLRCSVQQRPR
ncbi:hypothetical protein C1H46_011496 [Malus baccata]|uniref:FRIGIDA-like protein n=1 Tax=Malus baccata TaxID=106549 RepID=A0A540MVR0_MALBA|nr:hypothetical protein C1H46_011496 [Malus baccata]